MNTRTRKLTILAMLAALAYVVMYVCRISVLAAAPFLKYDPKDVIIMIGGFIYGPLAAAAMSVVVSFAEMFTVSETGIIGAVMNILSTCAFVCPAAFVYKQRHKLSGAVFGLITGMFLMTAVMLLWNYMLVPVFTPTISRETVAKMLLPIFLPFNLLKSGLNAALTMLIYKPVRLALSRARLLPETGGGKKSSLLNIGTMVVSLFAVLTGILLILVLQGKI